MTQSNKHTPAPWVVDDTIKEADGWKQDTWQILCVNEDMYAPHTIAHIEHYKEIPGQSNFIDANARLIAASPDLLKSTKDLIFICEQLHKKLKLDTTKCPQLQRAYEVLLKVEGEGRKPSFVD